MAFPAWCGVGCYGPTTNLFAIYGVHLTMPHLFSPLKLGRISLPNRIVLASAPSGYATPDGFLSPSAHEFYRRRAEGGAGLLIVEPMLVRPPAPDACIAHLGLYADPFVAGLAALATDIHRLGGRVCVALGDPCPALEREADVAVLREEYIAAGWRAWAAGCDGIILSSAEPGAIQQLMSPLHNHRTDRYGGTDGRLRLPVEILEGLREWLGRRLLVGFRLNADEMTAGGLTLQDTRVIARRLVAAGVRLLDVTIIDPTAAAVAHFPGWQLPIAAAIKRTLPDIPIMAGGGIDDPILADFAISDSSADLVLIGRALRNDPDWPRHAFAALYDDHGKTEPPLESFVFDDEDRYI
jgi:2,4-dienoyl-CoA reductase-like NADH-dependent reductase (Old Yellow Enzyme family)